MSYQNNKWLMPMVISENFLQVVGMGYIVVRFFYNDHQSSAASSLSRHVRPDDLDLN